MCIYRVIKKSLCTWYTIIRCTESFSPPCALYTVDIYSTGPYVHYWYKKKCTLVQALRLCIGRMAHRGSRGIALPFHDHGTRRGWGFSVTPWPLFTPGKDPVSIVQEAGWAPGPVWTGARNLASTRIQSPDRPAPSQSLYRLYPAHNYWYSDTLYRIRLSIP